MCLALIIYDVFNGRANAEEGTSRADSLRFISIVNSNAPVFGVLGYWGTRFFIRNKLYAFNLDDS